MPTKETNLKYKQGTHSLLAPPHPPLPHPQGPNDHTIAQIKDAVRDGLRAVKNTVEDAAVVPGGGALEVALAHELRSKTAKAVEGR